MNDIWKWRNNYIYIYYVGKCVRRCKCTMILWKVYLKNDKKSYILCIGCKYVIDENEKKKKNDQEM